MHAKKRKWKNVKFSFWLYMEFIQTCAFVPLAINLEVIKMNCLPFL